MIDRDNVCCPQCGASNDKLIFDEFEVGQDSKYTYLNWACRCPDCGKEFALSERYTFVDGEILD